MKTKILMAILIFGVFMVFMTTPVTAALTDNDVAKDWLATNAGVGNCFATAGVSYFTVEGDPKTGGTVNVISFLQVAGLLDATKSNIIVNGKSYNDYLAETGETGISDADIMWVAAHDEPTEDQWCSEITPIPEFSTIAIPIGAILGLVFLMSRKNRHSGRKNN